MIFVKHALFTGCGPEDTKCAAKGTNLLLHIDAMRDWSKAHKQGSRTADKFRFFFVSY